MDKKQKINCTVESCAYNNSNEQKCQLEAINVEPCYDTDSGNPEDESMCGSFEAKENGEL